MSRRTLASVIAAPFWLLCCPWRWSVPWVFVPIDRVPQRPTARPECGPPTPPPGGVIKVEKALTREARARLRTEWEAANPRVRMSSHIDLDVLAQRRQDFEAVIAIVEARSRRKWGDIIG